MGVASPVSWYRSQVCGLETTGVRQDVRGCHEQTEAEEENADHAGESSQNASKDVAHSLTRLCGERPDNSRQNGIRRTVIRWQAWDGVFW
jgi:hypothetical protein